MFYGFYFKKNYNQLSDWSGIFSNCTQHKTNKNKTQQTNNGITTTQVVVDRIASHDAEISRESTFEYQDMKLVGTMSKSTFLTFVITFAAIWQAILQSVRWSNNSLHADPFIIYLSNLFLIWNGFISGYVLYLKYNFSEKHYKKYCHRAHSLFERLCIHNSIVKIEEKRKFTEISMRTQQTNSVGVDNT